LQDLATVNIRDVVTFHLLSQILAARQFLAGLEKALLA